ncbi:hypothetical protein G5S34_12775 [Herbaspirillum frisingense]|uniref:hypothetical protein n=1 Tax=Herbaspirillum frisingense TaxID=92645 RepID=UPI001602FC04|nr:hypothetical protein [Herbaspirillum frisingense]QNB07552.1 hypothetical protein G5S34_12775 [Herbaspirillum frisingense]
MRLPNMDNYADFWLGYASQQIEASVELGATTLASMSKLYDLDTSFLRRETGNAILLAKQCVEARTPVEAASMMVERWRNEMQESAVFAGQLVEWLAELSARLNHATQERMTGLNGQYGGFLSSASSGASSAPAGAKPADKTTNKVARSKAG